jgi:hypothetical protein
MRKIAIAALVALVPVVAQAQEQGGADDTDSKQFEVIGTVPAMCSGGTLTGGNATFDLGVLIDTTTGFMRTDLSAPNKVLNGAFCSARSTIAVNATALAAENFTATPPAGFSRAVNYTATATGWSPTPASFNTGAATNPNAVQNRNTAFTGDITVGIGSFSTAGGATQRLVADTSYSGQITVTLSAVD